MDRFDLLFGLLAACGAIAVLIMAAGAVAGVVRFVQFWIEFAKGMNEAAKPQRGFEPKLNTADTAQACHTQDREPN